MGNNSKYYQVDFEEEPEDLTDLKRIDAVVQGADWTVETIVSQMKRGNIILNPNFQRRDAWSKSKKSSLIESLIVGLPVPQLVLAESNAKRGAFVVLDGKQRLLSILQFWGESEEDPNNRFNLSNLELKKELSGKTFEDMVTDSSFTEDYDALCNHTIRTVVIKNWKSEDLLHTIFLRLNTGSVTLSPQELRQALHPGRYTDFIDKRSAESEALHALLRTPGPDPRMRDAEILARFVAFRLFPDEYRGRMKPFLDMTFDKLNTQWDSKREEIEGWVEQFEAGLEDLNKIFDGKPARKPSSRAFNRAIFDALIYYHSDPEVRRSLEGKEAQVFDAYNSLFEDGSDFSAAIESDTAGRPHTFTRFSAWAKKLSEIAGASIEAPPIPAE